MSSSKEAWGFYLESLYIHIRKCSRDGPSLSTQFKVVLQEGKMADTFLGMLSSGREAHVCKFKIARILWRHPQLES
jgi:hypothetical protein